MSRTNCAKCEICENWPASSVRTHWRDIVADANMNGQVVVTHRNRAAVVILSVARFEQLKRRAQANETLTALRAEFDREMDVLRRRAAARKLRLLSNVTPAEIAKAANAAARRKR